MPRQSPLYTWSVVPSPCVPAPVPPVTGGYFPEIANDLSTTWTIAPYYSEITTTFVSVPLEYILDDDWAGYMSKFPEIANDLFIP